MKATENGMVVNAQDEWDKKCDEAEYEAEWIKQRAEEIRDNLINGYGVAYEVDATYDLGRVLTLHLWGKMDDLKDCLDKIIDDYAMALAKQLFSEADHDTI